MIKIYGMETCPDCTYVEEQVKGNNQYEVIDIGQHVRDLKAFLRLRDHHPAFIMKPKVLEPLEFLALYWKTVRLL